MNKELSAKRTGAVNKNTYGSLMEVVEYNRSGDILVKFEQGKPIHTEWQHFINGIVKSPYDKSVYNIGYIGEGDYKVSKNEKATYQYKHWHNMINRCYSEVFHKRNPTYKNCTVVEEWHNFQNFAQWCEDNYYKLENEEMHLDKDILVKGNRIYSAKTCIFVPKRINKLFVRKKASRGDFPIGVTYDKQRNKYTAQCKTLDGKIKKIGRYENPQDAFLAYKLFKEKLIKQIAIEYKDKIPTILYNTLMQYQVEIDD